MKKLFCLGLILTGAAAFGMSNPTILPVDQKASSYVCSKCPKASAKGCSKGGCFFDGLTSSTKCGKGGCKR